MKCINSSMEVELPSCLGRLEPSAASAGGGRCEGLGAGIWKGQLDERPRGSPVNEENEASEAREALGGRGEVALGGGGEAGGQRASAETGRGAEGEAGRARAAEQV